MTQISKSDLSPLVKSEIYNQLNHVVSECRDENEVELLFSELLTKTERIVIAKRLFIAVMLTKGYSYRDIRLVLGVSFPTVRSVQFWLEHGGKGYKQAVERILLEKKNIKILTVIKKIIDNEAKTKK